MLRGGRKHGAATQKLIDENRRLSAFIIVDYGGTVTNQASAGGDLSRTLAADVSVLVHGVAAGARVSRGPGIIFQRSTISAVFLVQFVVVVQFGQSLLDLLELRGVQLIFRRRWQQCIDLLLSSFDPIGDLGLKGNRVPPAAAVLVLPCPELLKKR